MDINHIKILSKNVRKNILKASLEAGSASAHIGGALSSVEILSKRLFIIFSLKLVESIIKSSLFLVILFSVISGA